MKYKKFLDDKLSIYPIEVRKYCIPYKYWKTKINNHPAFVKVFWKALLHRQCKRLDRFLSSSNYDNCLTNINNHNINNIIHETLCIINIDTLYKICKKIEKRIHVPALDYFFKDLCKKNAYKFLEASNETLIYNH